MTTLLTDSPPRQINIPYKPRKWARPMHNSFCRWMCLVLHRRAGKTVATINHLQRAATNDTWERRRLRALKPTLTDRQLRDLLRNRFYGHVLPTYKQAEVTAWTMLKYYGERVPGVDFNEQKLRVTYPNGSRLQLFGSDHPDALRGIGFSGIAFGEYGMHPPNVFSEMISKALADHLGFAIFLGTIKGQNQLYKTYQAGTDDADWLTVWQDVEGSLETETDATTMLLRQALEDDRKLIANGLMTQEEFDQEWYLSSDAAIKGAYYTTLLTAARKDGRITRVPYDPALPVDTDWDLGISDKMTIWFSQSLRSGEVRLIDYYEHSGEGIPHYVRVLKEKPYVYGEHWAPHDIQVRELGTGKSRLETARSHGIRFRIVRNIGVADGIDAARLLLPRCWFDEEKCRAGLEALTFYRKSYNERLQEFTDKPLHDWSSHGADAFRGLAVRHKPPKEKEVAEPPYRLAGIWQ